MPKPDPHPELERAVAAFLDAESRVPAGDHRAAPPGAPGGPGTADLDAVRADRALSALFAALPTPTPSRAFADQVLARVHGRLRPRDLDWRGRVATAAAFGLVVVGSYWILPIALGLAAGFEPAAVAGFIGGLIAFVVGAVGDALAVANRLTSIGRVLWLILTSPEVMATLTVCATLTLVMGRWLAHLLAVPRSSLHAVR
ncbi:MAG: hypothetical protein AAFX50_04310 [Acidobacteriota bacterium]